jgi:hypothetical protein
MTFVLLNLHKFVEGDINQSFVAPLRMYMERVFIKKHLMSQRDDEEGVRSKIKRLNNNKKSFVCREPTVLGESRSLFPEI